MARSLSKVQKKISKKRGGKPTALHENSRDAQRLRRAGAREDKVTRLMDTAMKANQIYGKDVQKKFFLSGAHTGSGQGFMVQSSTRRILQAIVRR